MYGFVEDFLVFGSHVFLTKSLHPHMCDFRQNART
jgi:hypothetical protein